jgi:hypothetical protein
MALIRPFLQRHWPALVAGLLLSCLELVAACQLAWSTPAGTRWLGNGMLNPGDLAVYLADIAQARHHSGLFWNLFSIESTTPAFSPIWSVLGWLQQLNIPPVALLLLAQVLASFLLCFVLLSILRRSLSSPTCQCLGLLFVLGGSTSGWLFFWLAGYHDPLRQYLPMLPDFLTELTPAFLAFSSPHIILSFALLLFVLEGTWNVKPSGWHAAAAAFLFSFHPYLMPVVLLFWATAYAWHVGFSWPSAEERKPLLWLALSPLPTLALYAWIGRDPGFRTHHLVVNDLPLEPWPFWILTFLPCLIALAARWLKRHPLRPHEHWLVGWTLAALLALCLPVPWKRKLVEALGVAATLVLLPGLTEALALLRRRTGTMVATGASIVLLLLAWVYPLGYFARQLAWSTNPLEQARFYQPNAVFQAWDLLRTASPSTTVVITDDPWLNLWTPAYAERHVWLGNRHETPNFNEKETQWREILFADATSATTLLAQSPVTDLLLTKPFLQKRLAPTLMAAGWRPVVSSTEALLLRRPSR